MEVLMINQFKQWPIVLFAFMVLGVVTTGCRGGLADLVIIETHQTEIVESVSVQVDNCKGRLPKLHLYDHPGGEMSGENLRAGSYHLFGQIVREVRGMYGMRAQWQPLLAPARTNREFALTVTTIGYRGVASGPGIDPHKLFDHMDVVYYYPFTDSIVVDGYQDLPCP
jgi:hypothetical protein